MLFAKELSLLLAAAGLCRAQHVVDLSGDGWTVRNQQGNVTVPGRLPSQVHLDLYAAKVIGECTIRGGISMKTKLTDELYWF